jgi:hypothetical protein
MYCRFFPFEEILLYTQIIILSLYSITTLMQKMSVFKTVFGVPGFVYFCIELSLSQNVKLIVFN